MSSLPRMGKEGEWSTQEPSGGAIWIIQTYPALPDRIIKAASWSIVTPELEKMAHSVPGFKYQSPQSKVSRPVQSSVQAEQSASSPTEVAATTDLKSGSTIPFPAS